ncbi:hypothetical protein JOB18_030757 [Solea senegalensis]|uniref:Uncharacterized protein n=1 Tax=Solea senegalensis TaxID=28829 RepID=A0AAV6RZX7_SOLSE|nr:hypothetical protein JOB18_030757 [Solea senegalensis]
MRQKVQPCFSLSPPRPIKCEFTQRACLTADAARQQTDRQTDRQAGRQAAELVRTSSTSHTKNTSTPLLRSQMCLGPLALFGGGFTAGFSARSPRRRCLNPQ